ncbi:MAG: hypothetical protein HQL99_08765 [Magnetococcales bacterium]|nr:hypothetical protein [Magnetococcales bacterium]
MFKFLFILALVGAVVFYLLRKRNIQIGLSPAGQETLWRGAQRLFRWLWQRLGL